MQENTPPSLPTSRIAIVDEHGHLVVGPLPTGVYEAKVVRVGDRSVESRPFLALPDVLVHPNLFDQGKRRIVLTPFEITERDATKRFGAPPGSEVELLLRRKPVPERRRAGRGLATP